MSVFGFSTQASEGGDFTPICKYDSRAGRMFRIDRRQDSSGTWEKVEDDITGKARFVADFENVETGWAHFPIGAAPSFVLVPMGSPLPARPTADHKNCVRFMLKLGADCGGDVRELASSAKAFLSGVEAVYMAYLEGKAANAGKLPIVALTRTTPIKTGSGAKSSTNYAPVFEIVGWAPRPVDLVFVPKSGAAPAASIAAAAPPATGSTVVPPPQVRTPEPASASEFG